MRPPASPGRGAGLPRRAEGDPDRALRLALADARVVLDEASAHISFGYVRGRLPIGLAEPAPEPGAGASVAAPSATYAA